MRRVCIMSTPQSRPKGMSGARARACVPSRAQCDAEKDENKTVNDPPAKRVGIGLLRAESHIGTPVHIE